MTFLGYGPTHQDNSSLAYSEEMHRLRFFLRTSNIKATKWLSCIEQCNQ